MNILDLYLEQLQSPKKQFIAIPGLGKKEIDFHGMKVYTSDTLKENVKKAIVKYFSKSVSPIIIQMIDEGKIVEAFRSKGIIDYFRKRKNFNIYAQEYRGTILLFIDSYYKKSGLGSVDEKYMSSALYHELIHVVAETKPSSFYNINHDLIITFWKAFFEKFLEVKNMSKVPDEPFDYLLKQQLKGWPMNFEKMFSKIFLELKKHTTINNFISRWRMLVHWAYAEFGYEGTYLTEEIKEAADYAYLKISKNNVRSFGQELWYPDEIISELARNNQNHPNVIKTIKLLK